MHTRKINIIEAEKFLCNNFSTPTHWPDWNLIISKYFKSSFFYIGKFDAENLIGIYPVHETKMKHDILKSWHSGLFHQIPYGGWIFNKQSKVTKKDFPHKLFQLNSSYCLPEIKEFNADYNDISYIQKYTLVIDITRDLHDLWSFELDGKRRNMVRKAEKKGISCTTAKYEKDIVDFYLLYSESAMRLGLRTLPIDLFFDLFNNTLNIKLIIVSAYDCGQQISNIAVMLDKNYAIYWLGNMANNALNNGQGELLQWAAIKICKDSGCSYYDLCYIEPELLPHIYQFKKGFSQNKVSVPVIKRRTLFYRVLNKLLI